MKLLTVIFPAYANPSYTGATPRPYDGRSLGKLEQAFLKMGEVFRERQHVERVFIGAGGHREHSSMTRYTLLLSDDKTSAADVVMAINENIGVRIEDVLVMGGE